MMVVFHPLTSDRFGAERGQFSGSIEVDPQMALTDLAIRHAKPSGKAYRLSDCHGLYLQINPCGSKLWYQKFLFENKENRMSLGPYPLISLAQQGKSRRR